MQIINKNLPSKKNIPIDITNIDFRTKLKLSQRRDRFYNKIFLMLASNETIPKRFEHFRVIDELLYYICPFTNNKKLCIPNSMIDEYISSNHDQVLGGGHHGVKKTYAKMNLKYYFLDMVKRITKYSQVA